MRINNNMMAINTHRQMLISQTAGAKSMEKLSSGYRINRAGDDAAGLAISEKMRGQIRGLYQASRNSQDMISLIQVAEGALAESHEILQRMRELSVQAANDTNTDADRFELQSEIKNLIKELDRIGNSTEFNTRKLLEGSARGVTDEVPGTLRYNNNSNVVFDSLKVNALMKSVSEDKSWAFDGAFMFLKTSQTRDGNDNDVYNANDFRLVGPDGKMYEFRELSPYSTIDPGYFEPGTIIAETPIQIMFRNTPTLDGEAAFSDYAAGIAIAEEVFGTTAAAVDIGNGSFINTGSKLDASGGNIVLQGYTGVTALTGQSITINGETFDLSAGENRTFTLNDGTILDLNYDDNTVTVKSGSIILGSDVAASATNILTSGTFLSSDSAIADGTRIKVQANYVLKAGETSANVTVGNNIPLTSASVTTLKEGSTLAKGSEVALLTDIPLKLNVAGTEIDVVYDANNTLRVNGVLVAPGKTITLDDGTVLTNRSTLADGGRIEVATGRITLARDLRPAADPTTPGIGENIANYWIVKDSTLQAGTQVTEGTILQTGTVFSEAGSYPFAGSITLGADGRYLQFGANTGNGLEARYYETTVGEGITFIMARYEPASSNLRDSIMGQIGANSGQTTFVSMGDMRARALGVADIDISSKWGAATAIETVNNALQRVSHQRAQLGAVQNRLEHTIKNLDTAAENMQAAEARIRDVDMAREIMENTKQSILQQAAQAMLAQANQVPQNVLQLLR